MKTAIVAYNPNAMLESDIRKLMKKHRTKLNLISQNHY